ncbi:hypothetical protein FB567DRAFT_515094 [Paraphoma chrysanthemicola]|uniref:Uncharacterized protein n=1 Tax=Paraphoma chrysanthemicola TaxID=798071 RepID=A0A8K0RF98_9PLEO|nr:hypothetical protein FB567DRAFT_515094 [Paraphoma chrysanthemicola]
MTTPPSYHLVNVYTSSPLTLDPKTTNLSLHAVPTPVDESLGFTFSAFAGTDFVQICTSIKFESYCLDVSGEKSTVPFLSENRRGNSQQWTVFTGNDGLVKLSNNYTGNGWYLNLQKDTNATIMTEGESVGVYWRQEAVSC